jgi:hypothetical protein
MDLALGKYIEALLSDYAAGRGQAKLPTQPLRLAVLGIHHTPLTCLRAFLRRRISRIIPTTSAISTTIPATAIAMRLRTGLIQDQISSPGVKAIESANGCRLAQADRFSSSARRAREDDIAIATGTIPQRHQARFIVMESITPKILGGVASHGLNPESLPMQL